MKLATGFLLATLAVVGTWAISEESLHSKFLQFKVEHGKSYSTPEEFEHRREIFKANIDKVDKHNAEFDLGLHSFKMSVNKFSDMTEKEFEATLNFKPQSMARLSLHKPSISLEDLPEEVNWINKGYVSNVKDQGHCGSCWAFAAVGAAEGAFVKSGKDLVSLSPQNLMDCEPWNLGCDRGGYTNKAFVYMQKSGIMTEADYPYTAKDGTCNFNSTDIFGSISSYKKLGHTEKALQQALAEVGPIAVSIDAKPIQSYSSGIIDKCNRWGRRNHAVLVVGYGTDNGQDYWLIKNSWGADWGEEGYFKLGRGKRLCKIGYDSSYPVV